MKAQAYEAYCVYSYFSWITKRPLFLCVAANGRHFAGSRQQSSSVFFAKLQ